jgi:hypothetical protein
MAESETPPAAVNALNRNPIEVLRASIAAGAERDRLSAAPSEAMPGFAEDEAKTDRVVPIVVLERI